MVGEMEVRVGKILWWSGKWRTWMGDFVGNEKGNFSEEMGGFCKGEMVWLREMDV